MNIYNNTIVASYLDLQGKPVDRTPDRYPYSYDMYVLYRDRSCECQHQLYSDHLHFKYPNYKEVMRETLRSTTEDFGQYTPSQLQDFLRVLLQQPQLKLAALMQGCNHANGFPVWLFLMDEPKNNPV